MQETLRECPHCGGMASLNAGFNYKQRIYYVYVKCNICGSQGKSFASPEDPEETNWNNEPCNNAVQAWNMRYNER